MDDLNEDDNEPEKRVSISEAQEIKAEGTRGESLENATKLQTDNSKFNFASATILIFLFIHAYSKF